VQPLFHLSLPYLDQYVHVYWVYLIRIRDPIFKLFMPSLLLVGQQKIFFVFGFYLFAFLHLINVFFYLVKDSSSGYSQGGDYTMLSVWSPKGGRAGV